MGSFATCITLARSSFRRFQQRVFVRCEVRYHRIFLLVSLLTLLREKRRYLTWIRKFSFFFHTTVFFKTPPPSLTSLKGPKKAIEFMRKLPPPDRNDNFFHRYYFFLYFFYNTKKNPLDRSLRNLPIPPSFPQYFTTSILFDVFAALKQRTTYSDAKLRWYF